MASEKWLASCHSRSLNTMRQKIREMIKQWDEHDTAVVNELTWLADYLDNLEHYLYYIMKRKDRERETEKE